MTRDRIVLPYPAEAHDHQQDQPDWNDLGFQADVNMLSRSALDRRRVLAMGLMGIGLLTVGCGTTATTTTDSGSTAGTGNGSGSGSGTATCTTKTPTETNGPYPADGTNGTNVLVRSGITRTDLRTSLNTGNTATGIPLSLTMKLVNVNASCAALSGYAVYIWHCTAGGLYSMYSSAITNEDYLRGVAVTDSNGEVTFTTIFPGCYSGRWPHIHFEVYPTLASATSVSSAKLISQIAMPETQSRLVYATTGYGNSTSNLNQISLSSDNVFSDGSSTQLPTMSGNTSAYTANITVGLSV